MVGKAKEALDYLKGKTKPSGFGKDAFEWQRRAGALNCKYLSFMPHLYNLIGI